jgi:hypothetical protein
MGDKGIVRPDFNDDIGMIGRGYAEAYERKREAEINGFLNRHAYLSRNKLEHIVDEIKDRYHIMPDNITVRGEHPPIAQYNGSKWIIDVAPYEYFDINRFNYGITLRGIFSKYAMPYELKDVKKTKKIIIKQQKDLEKIIKNLNK